ncbi:MAG: hypothetical protein ACREBK_07655 [Sphingomicrobium sp.]
MSSASFRTSKPDAWTSPRSHRDASQRRMTYGPLVPMDDRPGFFTRLFGVRA